MTSMWWARLLSARVNTPVALEASAAPFQNPHNAGISGWAGVRPRARSRSLNSRRLARWRALDGPERGRARRPWRAGNGGLGTARPTHGRFMESPLFLADLLTGHEPRESPSPAPAVAGAPSPVGRRGWGEGRFMAEPSADSIQAQHKPFRNALPPPMRVHENPAYLPLQQTGHAHEHAGRRFRHQEMRTRPVVGRGKSAMSRSSRGPDAKPKAERWAAKSDHTLSCVGGNRRSDPDPGRHTTARVTCG